MSEVLPRSSVRLVRRLYDREVTREVAELCDSHEVLRERVEKLEKLLEDVREELESMANANDLYEWNEGVLQSALNGVCDDARDLVGRIRRAGG